MVTDNSGEKDEARWRSVFSMLSCINAFDSLEGDRYRVYRRLILLLIVLCMLSSHTCLRVKALMIAYDTQFKQREKFPLNS